MAIEINIEIQRSIDEVFTFTSNTTNLPDYDDNIVEVQQITEGPIDQGTKYQLAAVQFGKRMTVNLEITRYEPNDHFSFRVEGGPFPVQTHYTFVSQDDTTKIFGKREPQPDGFWKLLTPLMLVPARKKFAGELKNLKEYLETH